MTNLKKLLGFKKVHGSEHYERPVEALPSNFLKNYLESPPGYTHLSNTIFRTA